MLRGVPPAVAETVASHVFEVGVTAYLLARRLSSMSLSIDLARALTMALLHDLEEAVIGDVVKPVKESVKGMRELSEHALRRLGLGDEELELIRDYHEGRSLEAIVVKLADLVATLNQACRYAEQGYEGVRDLILNVRREIDDIVRGVGDEDTARKLAATVKELVMCGYD
jgi:putative hydrolase of HD superfamily